MQIQLEQKWARKQVCNRRNQVLDDGTTVVTDEDMRTEGPIVDVEDEGFLKSAMKKLVKL